MWTLILGFLGSALKPIFDFLNARVDAASRIHISDNVAAGQIVGSVENTLAKSDELKAQIRIKEGKFSPWVVVTIVGFMLPFAWHTWQVVLDSSAWHIAIGPWFLPVIVPHVVGSWRVAALPGMFETTEHAVIQSLFIGASAAVGALPIIYALRRGR